MAGINGSVRRLVATAVSTLALVLADAIVAGPANAATFTQETESGSDPYSGSFECDGFSAHYVGLDHWTFTNWIDASGNPVRQEGKISATETDYNDSTSANVVVRTQLNIHVDFVADTQSLTGIRNFSNQPGSGAVIQSVGNLTVTASSGDLISVHGPADDIDLGGGFCEALAG